MQNRTATEFKEPPRRWTVVLSNIFASILDGPHQETAKVVLGLLPRWIFCCPKRGGHIAKGEDLDKRLRKFEEGQWKDLHESSQTVEPPKRRQGAEFKSSIRKKAERQIKQGHIHDAMRTLKQLPSPDITEELADRMEQMFTKEAPRLQPVNRKTPAVTAELLRKACSMLRAAKSPGLSGWRNEYLKLFASEASEKQFLPFLQLMKKYEVGEIAVNWWESTKIVSAFKKKDLTKKRDIHIREPLTQVLRKALTLLATDTFVKAGGHVQQGIGTPNGPENIAHLCQLSLDQHPEERVLFKIDIEDAYPTCKRSAVLNAAKKHCPVIAPFLHTSLSKESTLVIRTDNGELHEVGMTEGLAQGSMDATLCFGLGSLDWLLEINKEAKKRDKNNFVKAIQDDVILSLRARDVETLYPMMARTLKVKTGGVLSPRKTLVYAPDGVDISSIPENIPVVHDGLKFGGIPLGTEDFINGFTKKKEPGIARVCNDILSLKSTQIQLLLLRYAAPGLTTHWLRGLRPDMTVDLARFHSQAMRDTLRQIVESDEDIPDQAWKEATLPGMGLQFRDPISTRIPAAAASWSTTLTQTRTGHDEDKKWLESIYDNLAETDLTTHLRDLENFMREALELKTFDIFTNSAADASTKLQFKLNTWKLKNDREMFMDTLSLQEKQRIYAQQLKGSRVIFDAIPTTEDLTIPSWHNSYMINIIRQRIGMHHMMYDPNEPVCRAAHHNPRDDFHAEMCNLGPEVIARHDNLNILGAKCFKKYGYRVSIEPQHFYRGAQKPDLIAREAGPHDKDIAVDWSIVHPCQGRSIDPRMYTSRREAEKNNQYLEPTKDRGALFYPLVFNAYGGMGSSAARFFNNFWKRHKKIRGSPRPNFTARTDDRYWLQVFAIAINIGTVKNAEFIHMMP